VDSLAAGNAQLDVATFSDDPSHLIRQADAVIAMGGYNTVCDILTYAPRALIVPRVRPREEQLIRAVQLAERGLLDVLHPDALTPDALVRWATGASRAGDVLPVRLHTSPELHALLASVLAPRATPTTRARGRFLAGEAVRAS
jgi:predicted glycosyltransferase